MRILKILYKEKDMVINDTNNFVSIVARLLIGLGYTNVKENEAGSAIDITAEKDGGRYCFKCRYDIDAIGAKSISDFAEAAKSAGYDNRIYVTNSSFLSAAKRAGEEKNVTLWDRNTIDRMYIGVSDSLEDKVVPVRRSKAAYVVAAVVILVIAAAAVYWFVFR